MRGMLEMAGMMYPIANVFCERTVIDFHQI